MIVVVADDFTGAAELAGVALGYGLSAEIQTEFTPDSTAEVIAVDTFTRSSTPGEAARQVAEVAKQIHGSNPEWIYKKIDSVLRGHVLAEVEAMLRVFGLSRALLVPANPGRGRVIREGNYYVEGKALEKTDFSRDPEYPARSSRVLALLGPRQHWPIHMVRLDQWLTEPGISVAEASTEAELSAWVDRLGNGCLAAGAAEFFHKALEARIGRPQVQAVRATGRSPLQALDQSHWGRSSETLRGWGKTLFVSGSASRYVGPSRHDFPVCQMPADLFRNEVPPAGLIRDWSVAVVRALTHHDRAEMRIRGPGVPDEPPVKNILNHLLCAVVQVLERVSVDHLCIEGGSTASTLTRHLGWNRMRAKQELAPGVVLMQVHGQDKPLLVVKPGSYSWPAMLTARRSR